MRLARTSRALSVHPDVSPETWSARNQTSAPKPLTEAEIDNVNTLIIRHLHSLHDDVIRRRAVAAEHPVDVDARRGGNTGHVVLVVIGPDDPRSDRTVGIAVVVWVIVRYGRIGAVVIISDEVVTARDLAAIAETSSERGPGIVNAGINDGDVYALAEVTGGLDSVRLELEEIGVAGRG